MARILRILLYPLVLIGMVLVVILVAIICILDKIYPDGKLLFFFYKTAHERGHEASVKIVQTIKIDEEVEVISDLIGLKVFKGDRGVVTFFDGKLYTVEFNKYDCCTYAPIDGCYLRKVKNV